MSPTVVILGEVGGAMVTGGGGSVGASISVAGPPRSQTVFCDDIIAPPIC